jgi:hypothetical protein
LQCQDRKALATVIPWAEEDGLRHLLVARAKNGVVFVGRGGRVVRDQPVRDAVIVEVRAQSSLVADNMRVDVGAECIRVSVGNGRRSRTDKCRGERSIDNASPQRLAGLTVAQRVTHKQGQRPAAEWPCVPGQPLRN